MSSTLTKPKRKLVKKQSIWQYEDSLLALDTETNGLHVHHGDKPFMVSVTNVSGKSKVWEWDVNPKTKEVKFNKKALYEIAKHILNKRLIFHHAKFDIPMLASYGLFIHFPPEEWPVSCHPWFLAEKLDESKVVRAIASGWEDTFPASHVDDSKGTHALKELALMHFDYPEDDETELLDKVKQLTKEAVKKGYKVSRKYSGKNPDGTPKTDPEYEADYWLCKVFDPQSTLCSRYAACDTERTMLLWIKRYYPMFQEDKALFRCYQREKNLIPVVYAMEHGGITVSKNSLRFYKKKLSKESIPHRKKAEQIAVKTLKRDEFNSNSYPQLRELLYTKKGFNLPVIEETDKGNPATDIGSDEKPGTLLLLRNNHCDNKPLAKSFLNHLTISKSHAKGITAIEGYERVALDHWDKTKWVLYPNFNPNGTDTTRFSSWNPNLQNVSKRSETPLRNIFSPPEGKVWWDFDYQQLQLRIFAYITAAKVLIEAFRKGHDFHATVASKIFKKAYDLINKLERRIAKNTNFALIFGATKAKVNKTAGIDDAYDLFSSQFPMVTAFLNAAIRQVRNTGGIVTPFGYPLGVNRKTPYAGGNYIIQGCEGDVIKNAMVLLIHLGLIDYQEYRIVIQVHDSLLIESPEDYDERRIRKIMGVMEWAGRMLDMETPVDAELITTHWGRGVKQSLKPIYPDAKKCKEIIYGTAA